MSNASSSCANTRAAPWPSHHLNNNPPNFSSASTVILSMAGVLLMRTGKRLLPRVMMGSPSGTSCQRVRYLPNTSLITVPIRGRHVFSHPCSWHQRHPSLAFCLPLAAVAIFPHSLSMKSSDRHNGRLMIGNCLFLAYLLSAAPSKTLLMQKKGEETKFVAETLAFVLTFIHIAPAIPFFGRHSPDALPPVSISDRKSPRFPLSRGPRCLFRLKRNRCFCHIWCRL